MDLPQVALPIATGTLPQLQSGDAPALDAAVDGIDFAALLALGLNLPQASCDPKLADSELATTEKPHESDPATQPGDLTGLLNQVPVHAQTAAPVIAAVQVQTPSLPTSTGAQAGARKDGGAQIEATDTATRAEKVAASPANLAAERATSLDAAAHGPSLTGAVAARAETHPDFSPANLTDTLSQLDAHAHAAPQVLPSLLPVETRPAATQPSALLEVAAPISDQGFADALSRQVVWMVDKDAQVAELRINPPDLGPVEVRLTLKGDEAQAQFVAVHAEVRDAIESSLTRLREALAQSGIQLGDASVSAESFANQARQDHGASQPRYGSGTLGTEIGQPRIEARISAGRGLVDTFA
jgi:flagellar hook-length control protein FliK